MRSFLHDKTRTVYAYDRASIFIDLRELSDHIEFSKGAIETEIKRLDDEINQTLKSIPEDDKDDYLEYMSDQYEHASSVIPNIQWRSEFISIYSFFEFSLNKICKACERRGNLNLSFKDLSGQGITRARNYLVKVVGIEQPFQTSNWQRAKFLADVRNAIVHRNAEIDFTPTNPKSLSAKLSNEPFVNLYKVISDADEAEIIIGYEFVKASLDELSAVIHDVCDYQLYPELTTDK